MDNLTELSISELEELKYQLEGNIAAQKGRQEALKVLLV